MTISLPSSILKSPSYSSLKERRALAASEARAAQTAFRRHTASFIVGTAVAAICSGLVLYGIEASPDESSNFILKLAHSPIARTLLFVFQGVSLGIAAYSAHLLSTKKYDTLWAKRRLEAESGRLELEKIALQLGHESGPQDFKTSGRSFIAFVEGQLGHLETSMNRHKGSANLLAKIGAGMAGVAAIATALSSIDHRAVIVLFAFIGVCTPALAAALGSWTTATANEERVELHRQSWHRLSEVYGEKMRFDQAVGSHDLPGALAYADQVFEVLRLDHHGFEAIHRRKNA